MQHCIAFLESCYERMEESRSNSPSSARRQKSVTLTDRSKVLYIGVYSDSIILFPRLIDGRGLVARFDRSPSRHRYRLRVSHPYVSVSIINNRKRKEWSTGARISLDSRETLRISVRAGVHESCVHVWPRIIWRISGGVEWTLVPSNIEISNSFRVPFFPCATFESRFDALAFPGPMRRDRARCSVEDEEKDEHHHAQGTWQERRRPCWYLCSRVYVSIPFARTSSSSWRYVLGVYEYYPSLLPSRSLFIPYGSTAARTRATTSSNWSPEEKEMRGLLSSNLASLRFFPSFLRSLLLLLLLLPPLLLLLPLLLAILRVLRFPSWQSRTVRVKRRGNEGRKEGGERKERLRGIRKTRHKRERGTERRSGFEGEETRNEGKMEEYPKAV